MLIELKKGNKIYIKPKNRGKFTKYCHGKVTDECIRKAKASGNPTLVKRATFADNARHFKHKEGGKAFVNGVNVLDSNPNAYKNVKKKYKMHLEGGPIINNSSIVASHFNWLLGMSDYLLKKKELDEKKKELELLKRLLESDMISSIAGTAINTGLNYLTNKFGNSALQLNGTPSKTTTTSSNNILKTGYEPYKSGYVDLFGNSSIGMGGLQFDKNFNLVLKPLNYYNV